MSLRIVGDSIKSRQLVGFLSKYEELSRIMESSGSVCSDSVGVDSNMDTESTLHVENKYYKANLVIQFGDDINNIKEGVIIVSDESELEIFDSKYSSVASHAHENDLALRLFVTFHKSEDSLQQNHREKFLNWSLDYGFEHIEIFMGNLMDDYLSRDKVGLPRLMEALQSTMWSTMVRHATANHSLRKVPLGSAAIETQHGKDVDSIGDTTAADTNAVNDKIDSNNFEDTTQDDEDLNFFDAFASALAEARTIRDRAREGEISDSERRNRAAEMANRLMQMLDLDDDDD